ncbi:GNAT family N-acetyltransferase [Ulvibacterium sp.]|uniref:GNAT family N-acetyltransferase n=1 Tax=Ulvibacterium sp. TaxID=2665914 RepID=UPI00261D0354|nr:GNAT family N-acetyltransferase [Ulvibacterium sp.]
MNGITIRPALFSDLPILQKFEQGVIKAERPLDPTIRKAPVNYYDLEAMIRDDEVAVMVAEYEGNIVASGYGMAKRARHYLDHTNYAYLGFMYTVPEFRGKGVNQKILAALKDWAISKNLTEIRLTVYEDNPNAIRAYEKFGFKRHIIEMRLL